MLANIVVETKRIDFQEGFDVRGLSSEDFAYLFKYHLNSLRDFMADIESLGDVKLGEGVIDLFPAFIAAVIALGSGDINAIKNARELPMAVQAEAFSEIWDLTFPRGNETETEHLKKVWKTISQMLAMSSLPTKP